MQIFLDSANFDEINQMVELGIIDGITTNPSLISGQHGNYREIITNITTLIKGDVSIEINATSYENMLIEGQKLLNIASNIVLKLPMTWDGIRACKYFSQKNIKVNLTLCFTPQQALIGAKAGASYVSLFIGRLEDHGIDGYDLISDVRQIFDNYHDILSTKILAASIRNPLHIAMSAKLGADIATMPAKVIKELITHPLTISGIKKFENDWQNFKNYDL